MYIYAYQSLSSILLSLLKQLVLGYYIVNKKVKEIVFAGL